MEMSMKSSVSRTVAVAFVAVAATFGTAGAHALTAQQTGGPNPDASPALTFTRDVAPILQQRCLSCHNERDRRGGLSLQSAEAINAGGESGTVMEAGDAQSSYLLDLLIPTDGVAEMRSAVLLEIGDGGRSLTLPRFDKSH